MALRDFFRRFRRALPQPFMPGNRVQLLIDGGAFYPAVLEAIAGAQRTIFLETYILQSDRTGWRIAEALAARARAGVEVAVCYDGYGSLSLPRDFVSYLREAGVKTVAYRPVSVLKRVWPWQKRNHRKSVIVDTRLGIVGGQNISDDYAPAAEGGKNWRDTAVRVEGPAVAPLEAMFRRMWAQSGGDDLETPSSAPPRFDDGDQVRFLGNFARRDRSFIRREYLLAILGAERTIHISNAYFVPDRVLRRALIRAAKRGVKVEIIVGGATDVQAVLHMSRGLYGGLLQHGIILYEWHDRVLHAKTAVIDGEWSTIGSSNLDNLSQFKNFEVNAGILGERFGRIMEDQFAIDRARSSNIALERWAHRSQMQRAVEWFFAVARQLFYGR